MFIVALLKNLLIFLIPAVCAAALALRLARRAAHEWTLLVWIPVLPLLIWGVVIAWDGARDPTSHNLWPFELLVCAGATSALFGLVMLGRRLGGRPARPWDTHGTGDGTT